MLRLDTADVCLLFVQKLEDIVTRFICHRSVEKKMSKATVCEVNLTINNKEIVAQGSLCWTSRVFSNSLWPSAAAERDAEGQ